MSDENTTRSSEAPLYFFPDQQVTPSQLCELLETGSHAERCWAVSHLLRYAEWDDIWLYVSRDEVREIFTELKLPESLGSAWARMLKLEAPVA